MRLARCGCAVAGLCTTAVDRDAVTDFFTLRASGAGRSAFDRFGGVCFVAGRFDWVRSLVGVCRPVPVTPHLHRPPEEGSLRG